MPLEHMYVSHLRSSSCVRLTLCSSGDTGLGGLILHPLQGFLGGNRRHVLRIRRQAVVQPGRGPAARFGFPALAGLGLQVHPPQGQGQGLAEAVTRCGRSRERDYSRPTPLKGLLVARS
jgi:hypothetical protein